MQQMIRHHFFSFDDEHSWPSAQYYAANSVLEIELSLIRSNIYKAGTLLMSKHASRAHFARSPTVEHLAELPLRWLLPAACVLQHIMGLLLSSSGRPVTTRRSSCPILTIT